LRAQGCRQFFFKYCSTFDSTDKGNIGPVADALLDAPRAAERRALGLAGDENFADVIRAYLADEGLSA